MRTILLFAFLIFNISAHAQLKFNQHPLESINKWVAVNLDKETEAYNFGFIYIDPTAGLTYHHIGSFKIEEDGTYKLLEKVSEFQMMKQRLSPGRYAVAHVPSSQLEALELEEFPSWYEYYKMEEDSPAYYYSMGHLNNAWGFVRKQKFT